MMATRAYGDCIRVLRKTFPMGFLILGIKEHYCSNERMRLPILPFYRSFRLGV